MVIALIIIGLLLMTSIYSTATTYGMILPKSTRKIFLDKYLDTSRLNMLDPTMMKMSNHMFDYISNVPFGIFVHYYIKGYGTIPRWSEAHRRIKARFKYLKLQTIK